MKEVFQLISTLEDIASRMAQELTDIIEDAADSGSSLPTTQALVDEWEAIHARMKDNG